VFCCVELSIYRVRLGQGKHPTHALVGGVLLCSIRYFGVR
jgi:hypothetical protein